MTAPFISGRHVGAVVEDEDEEPFEEKMCRLTVKLREQMADARWLEEAIGQNLRELGYDA
jgi:type I restriction enzyme M protein